MQKKKSFEDFYNGFTNSLVTLEGIKDEKISSQNKKNLDTYFVRAYKRQPAEPEVERLPPPYDKLLPMQDKSGKWNNLPAVLECLDMPPDATLGQNLDPSVEATVFAIAAIRQRPELASKMMEAHDLGFQWVSSRGLVTLAIEMIFNFQEPDYKKQYKASIDRTGQPKPVLSDIGNSHVQPRKDDGESLSRSQTMSRATSMISQNALDERSQSVELPELVMIKETEGEDSSSNSMSKSQFTAAYPSLDTVNKSPTKQQLYESAQLRVEEHQDLLVKYATQFDKVCKEVRQCADRCIKTFQTAPTHELRNQAFEELTCMLGPGLMELPGVLDWRRHGAPSFRETCISVLAAIDDLATLRLDAQEAYLNWKGRPAIDPKIVPELLTARWTFTWEGRDLALIVLHSLDWLQQNRFICNWFGRPFSLTVNPLALPLNLVDLYNQLNLEPKVQEMLEMRPFRRVLCGVVGSSGAWKQREYLLKWQVQFEGALLSARVSSLWPVIPDTVHYEDCDRIFRALLVLFIKGRMDIMRGVGVEQTNLSNKSLAAASKLLSKTLLGPAAGKHAGKWRGTFDLAAGRDNSALVKKYSTGVGNQYRPLPKLKRRPTMPWPKEEGDNGASPEQSMSVHNNALLHEGVATAEPVPLAVEAPIELHLTVTASPEKNKKKKLPKKIKKEKPAVVETIEKPMTLKLSISSPDKRAQSSLGSNDDNSSSATSSMIRSPSKQNARQSSLKLKTASKKNVRPRSSKGKKKKAKSTSEKRPQSVGPSSSPSANNKPSQPQAVRSPGKISLPRMASADSALERRAVSRASFPAEVKLTRRVDQLTRGVESKK